MGELEDVGEGEVPEAEETLELLATRFELLDRDLSPTEGSRPIAAIFEEDEINDLSSNPNLVEMTAVALERLSSDERPFLLLVECEEADSASHRNDIDRLLRGMSAIEAALELLLDFAERDGETLVLFTSDHETGGLALSIHGVRNLAMRALWATGGHTGSAVPWMASGPGAEALAAKRTNWELGRVLRGLLVDPGTVDRQEAAEP